MSSLGDAFTRAIKAKMSQDQAPQASMTSGVKKPDEVKPIYQTAENKDGY